MLISIILALGMTQVLTGVGEMLQARKRRRFYWVHAVWVFNLFLFLVIAWWIFYRWRHVTEWNYFLFLFLLIAPTILYLAALVLFPSASQSNDALVDYKAHFYANHRSFFILFGLWVPVDVADTLLKGTAHFVSLGLQYILSVVLLTTVFSVAAISRNERVHAVLAVYFVIHTGWISWSIFRTLI